MVCKTNTRHVKFAYMNKKAKQVMYLKCTICKKHFSENKGTIYFRRKKNKTMITQVLQNTTEDCGIRATARVFNISKDTVLAWVKEVGKYLQVLGKKIYKDVKCDEVQLDEFWSFIAKKQYNLSEKEKLSDEIGDMWTFTALLPAEKLIAGHVLGKRTLMQWSVAMEHFVNTITE